jgi:uncharacterized membrane protein
MDTLSKMFYANQKQNQLLISLSFYCLILMLLRAKITHSIYLFFLIWNLILAGIPYLIILYVATFQNHKKNKIKTIFFLLVWLLFLPNSFYIITDLVHLSRANEHLFWFDLILISSFSISGCILGLVSMLEFEKIIRDLVSIKIIRLIIPMICFLSGFGIFLGRMLRFNSWEILSNPMQLINDSLETFFTTNALLFSINFGIFIYVAFLIKKMELLNNKS